MTFWQWILLTLNGLALAYFLALLCCMLLAWLAGFMDDVAKAITTFAAVMSVFFGALLYWQASAYHLLPTSNAVS